MSVPKEEEKKEKRHEEYQVLDLFKECLGEGADEIDDRTGVGTFSVFGRMMKFSLHGNTLPLLTTKRVFFRGVKEELLWFISGSTNSNDLESKGITIWKANGSKDFLEKRGLTGREEGDLGPMYSFQWRHFGYDYKGCHYDYNGLGYDQLKECINMIKNNHPNDKRRIVMTSWNPTQISEMALPPCHVCCQFSRRKNPDPKKNVDVLDCSMFQRSADVAVGVPFNIASYSLLTMMIAHVCGIEPGTFTHFMSDVHVYKNLVPEVKEQLKREPRPFPKLKIKRNVSSIDDFKSDDIDIEGYDPHPPIKMVMNA